MGHSRVEPLSANPSNAISLCSFVNVDITPFYSLTSSQKIISAICADPRYSSPCLTLSLSCENHVSPMHRPITSRENGPGITGITMLTYFTRVFSFHATLYSTTFIQHLWLKVDFQIKILQAKHIISSQDMKRCCIPKHPIWKLAPARTTKSCLRVTA